MSTANVYTLSMSILKYTAFLTNHLKQLELVCFELDDISFISNNTELKEFKKVQSTHSEYDA